MNKRLLAAALLVSLLLTGGALAAEEFDGTVIAGETVGVTAPYGGTIASVSLRAGETISVGDGVAEIATTKVVAVADGTIRGVFAAEGDSADKTVMYLAPVSKYTIACSIGKAYASASTKYVRIGETVYIKCAADGSHRAIGTIIAVNGSDYTVQTTGGELYMEETVYLYRSDSYASSARIGSGTVGRTAEIAVQGSGSLLKLYVSDGDEVERGQLLMETVEGDVDAMTVNGSTILSTVEGVIAEVKASAGQKVNKGDSLLTVYPSGTYQIRFTVPEDLLSAVQAGDKVRVSFNWDETQARACEGVVTDISYVSDASEGSAETTYSGYVSFAPDESVRLGMNVVVSVINAD